MGEFLYLTLILPSAFSSQAAGSLGCPTVSMATGLSFHLPQVQGASWEEGEPLTSAQPSQRLCVFLSGLFQGLNFFARCQR